MTAEFLEAMIPSIEMAEILIHSAFEELKSTKLLFSASIHDDDVLKQVLY